MKLPKIGFILSCLCLFVGCQNAQINKETLANQVNHQLNEATTYQQATQISQKTTTNEGTQTAQQTNQLTIENNELVNATVISKQSQQPSQYLELKQEDGTTYTRELDSDWLKVAHPNQERDQFTLLTMQEIQRIVNEVANDGEWNSRTNQTTIDYHKQQDDLLNLFNRVAIVQLNPKATHDITITINPKEQTLTHIHWTITGTNRSTGEPVKATVDIQSQMAT